MDKRERERESNLKENIFDDIREKENRFKNLKVSDNFEDLMPVALKILQKAKRDYTEIPSISEARKFLESMSEKHIPDKLMNLKLIHPKVVAVSQLRNYDLMANHKRYLRQGYRPIKPGEKPTGKEDFWVSYGNQPTDGEIDKYLLTYSDVKINPKTGKEKGNWNIYTANGHELPLGFGYDE